MKAVSVVIPCFNEAAVLPELFQRLTAAADTWPYSWTVVCVDDGSRDETRALLRAQHERDGRWRAISFSRNFGHQAAVSAGLCYAPGDAVVVMDADLQDPPEEIHRFLAKWSEGNDVVYAVRASRKEGPIKRFCYWAFYRFMARLVPFEIPLDTGDFCVLDRRVVDVLNALPERRRFVRGLRAWAGFRQVGMAYERSARHAGDPKYTFSRLLRLAKDGVFSFSAVPLRFASHMGLWISLLSMLGVGFTIAQRVFRSWFAQFGLEPVPGFATIVISILFLGGVQLLSLGIIGEYLERIFEEVKGRPAFVIDSTLGLDVGNGRGGAAGAHTAPGEPA
ncbi:MAG: glycosyltransferase family 2 protein [Vicinamibacterales bacterium]